SEGGAAPEETAIVEGRSQEGSREGPHALARAGPGRSLLGAHFRTPGVRHAWARNHPPRPRERSPTHPTAPHESLAVGVAATRTRGTDQAAHRGSAPVSSTPVGAPVRLARVSPTVAAVLVRARSSS